MSRAPSPVVQSFRRRLKTLMDERVLDSRDLASASGVSEAGIRNLLTGPDESLPTLWTAVRLAHGLKLGSVDALLGTSQVELLATLPNADPD